MDHRDWQAGLELPMRGDHHEHGNGRCDLGSSVCLVTDSQEPSGVGEHMLALGAKLGAHSHVAFVCPPSTRGGHYLERAADSGMETLGLDWRRPLAAERFSKWLSFRQFDICHVHAGITWEGLDLVKMARQSSVPVVIRTEHLPYLLTNEFERVRHANALQNVDRLVCVSNEARASFVAAGISTSLISVIRNGIRPLPVRHDRGHVRSLLGLGDQSRVVLTVARFAEQKDHHTLLDAVPAVLAREPQARFVWAGSGPLEEEIRKAVRSRGLDERVIFLGHRQDIPDLMSASDLFVLPSRFEGLPLTVLEAMAAGLPIVATRVCGTAETVQDRVTGFLVEPGASQALAVAISELLADPRRAAQLGARGRVRALRVFGIGRMARETFDLYDELLRQSRPSSGSSGKQVLTSPHSSWMTR
jgi:glycosyltransferase involved in cell wall biosynthesis